MTIAEKIFWVLLYLAAFIPVGFSLYFYTEKSLISALISSLIMFLIYTILIFKNIKILSIVSFITLLVMAFFMFGISVSRTNNAFSSVLDEKTFMLTLSLIIIFLLVNSIFWLQTKKGLSKIISVVLISLSICLLVIFGASTPDYHQNFVYTRINVLIFLMLGIYLIKKKKKLLGLLGIFMSIGMLLLSAGLFAGRTYTPEEKEQQEVIAFLEPKAKEMFGYYNKEDYKNFCKYCGSELNYLFVTDPTLIIDKRMVYGPYMYFGEPKVKHETGLYYVEYPVKFQNVKNLMYLTFVIENISTDSSIYSFTFSDKQEQ